MKDMTKMMIFMFLGLIFAIAVLGYHKSGRIGRMAEASASPTGTPTALAHPYYARTNLYRWGN